MKGLYQQEKKRIGLGRWAVLVVFLFFYFCMLQRKASYIVYDGLESEVIFLYNQRLICILGVFFITYLNSKLFFIHEQGKTIYLLKKFDITPVRKTTMYQIRIRIIVESAILFVAGSYVVYLCAAKANYLMMEKPVMVVLKLLLLAVVMTATAVGLLFGLDLYQERREGK